MWGISASELARNRRRSFTRSVPTPFVDNRVPLSFCSLRYASGVACRELINRFAITVEIPGMSSSSICVAVAACMGSPSAKRASAFSLDCREEGTFTSLREGATFVVAADTMCAMR